MPIDERRDVPSVPLYPSVRVPAIYAVRTKPGFSERLPQIYRRMHAHRFYTLYFVENGSGSLRLGDATIELMRGMLVVVAPQQTHDIVRLDACNLWIVAYEPQALDSCILSSPTRAGAVPLAFVLHACAFSGQRRAVPGEQYVRWLVHLAWLRKNVTEPEPIDARIERPSVLTLNVIGIDVARLYVDEGAAPLSLWKSPVFEDMQRYIETHYHFPISLRNVAAALKLSPSYLTDLVHRQSGGTVLAWINARRFIDARRLLAQTALPVAQIAVTCGFSDANNFVRRFARAHAGLAPSVWRAAAQGQAQSDDDGDSFAAHWRFVHDAG